MNLYRIKHRQGGPIDVHANTPKEAKVKLLDYLKREMSYDEKQLAYIESQMMKPRLLHGTH